MTNIVYTNFLKQLMSGTIDLLNDNIYAMLVSGSYVPSTGHVSMSSILPHQSVDPLGSYVSGGTLLTSKALIGVGGNAIAFDAADVSWSSATITASGAVLWHSGSVSVRNPIAWVELGNQSSTNGTFQIVWNSTNGLFKITGS